MVAKIVVALDAKPADKKLAGLLKSVQNPAPLYAAIGSQIANRIRLCFRMGIDPWGRPWLPIKWRAPRSRDDRTLTRTGRGQVAANAGGSAGQPLRDTGRLARSITSKADAAGVTVGTNVRYARTHQFGATIKPTKAKRLVFPGPSGALIFAKKVTVPGRPFMPLRRGESTVALPPAWSLLVVGTIKRFLKSAAGSPEKV